MAAKSDNSESQWDAMNRFKKMTRVEDIQAQFKEGQYVIFKIFDKVKVFVDTTEEFPLDIKCTLVLTPEDQAKYQSLVEEEQKRKEPVVIDADKQVAIAGAGLEPGEDF